MKLDFTLLQVVTPGNARTRQSERCAWGLYQGPVPGDGSELYQVARKLYHKAVPGCRTRWLYQVAVAGLAQIPCLLAKSDVWVLKCHACQQNNAEDVLKYHVCQPNEGFGCSNTMPATQMKGSDAQMPCLPAKLRFCVISWSQEAGGAVHKAQG